MPEIAEVLRNIMARRLGPSSLTGVLMAVGEFTPAFTFATPGDLSVSYSEQVGNYQKLGDVVFFYLGLTCTPTYTTSSGSVRITGLPEMGSVDQEPPVTASVSSTGLTLPGSTTAVHADVANNQTYLHLVATGSGASANLTASDFTSGTQIVIRLNGYYFAGTSQLVNVEVEISGVQGTGHAGTITVSTSPVAPSLSVDFSTQTIGTGVFSSDTGRRYRNGSLDLVTASANSPRYHRGIDGLVQGIVLERASDSHILNNASFATASGWTHTGLSVVSSTRADVFGTSTAYELDEGTGTSNHQIQRDMTGIADNEIVCLYALVKRVDADYVSLMLRTKANSFSIQRFNIEAMSYAVDDTINGTTGTVYSAGIEYWGEDYYLIWASFNAESGATALRAHLTLVNAAGDTNSYTGTNRSFIVSAFSNNLGTYPQLFYTVGSSAVSKTADTLTYSSAHQPANDFSVYVSFYGSDTTRISGTPITQYLYQSGNFSIRRTDNDIIANFNGNTLTHTETIQPGAFYEVEVVKETTGMELYVNSTTASASNTGAAYQAAITPGTIYIGSDSSGSNHADVAIKRVIVDSV